jgi:moderate conductance mechanosensitive channel
MTILGHEFDPAIGAGVGVLITVVAVVVLRWLVRRLVDRTVRGFTDATLTKRLARARVAHDSSEQSLVAAERTAARARTIGGLLTSVATFVIVGTGIVVVLGLVGVNVAPIIASAGVIGIAVGFGAQSLIKDFLTGVFMVFEDQYGVGDVVDTGQASGTVEQVGLRITTLRDDNGVIWYVPNGSIARVGNKSQGWAVADVEVPVGVGEDLDAVRGLLADTADTMAHDREWDPVVLDEPAQVTVESIGAESVVVRVRLQTQPMRQAQVARELRVRVKDALDGAGVAYTKGPRAH